MAKAVQHVVNSFNFKLFFFIEFDEFIEFFFFFYERKISEMRRNKMELHWLSGSRISSTENRIHTLFDIHSYCEAIEDQLFSRALIGAVYQCLLQGTIFSLFFNREKFINFILKNLCNVLIN